MIDAVVVLRSILEAAFYFLVISSFKRISDHDEPFSITWRPNWGGARMRLFAGRRPQPVVSYLEPINGILTRAAPIGTYHGKTIHEAIALESGDCYKFDRISPVAQAQMSRTGAFTIQLASDEYVDGTGIIYRRM